jgi:calcium-dependent protein kinase
VEVEVLRRVRGHDNIIHLLEVLECNGEWYLITELCEGGDLLDRLIANGRYDEETCASVLFNAASGLNHVHQCGYVHCDVKPENFVFVSKQVKGDDVRLIDFGMAKDLYSIQKAGGLSLRSSPITVTSNDQQQPRVGKSW